MFGRGKNMPEHKKMEDKSKTTKNAYITKFDARCEEILRRKLAGERNVDIARAVGLSDNRVSFIVTSPLFIEKMTERTTSINKKFEERLATDPIKAKFQRAADKASDILIDLMDSCPIGPLKRNIANDVLEYSGQTKKPTEDHSTKIYIDKRTGNDIKIAVKALKMDMDIIKDLGLEGVVIDVEPTSGDQSESIGSSREEKLLDILPRDNAERLVDREGTSPVVQLSTVPLPT